MIRSTYKKCFMKRILLFLLFCSSLLGRAQSFNNEWIDYSKTYYKFRVGANGLYRISQASLASIGLNATNADHFQLWRHGQQIPLYTTVQNAPLGAADYIEFWGEMNDGKADKPLYRHPDWQLADKWSLFTDTACYFLTVNTSGGNARLVPTANNVAGNTLSPEPFFMHTAGRYFKDIMYSGRGEKVGTSMTYSASFEAGESWGSTLIYGGTSLPIGFSNLNTYTGPGAPDPILRITAVGNAIGPRNFVVKVNGDSILGRVMDYFDYSKAEQSFSLSKISSGNANVEVVNQGTTPNDNMAVDMTEITYPRQFNFGGESNFYFELPANAAGNYLEIAGFNHGGTVPVLYDLTNGRRYEADITNPSLVKIALLPSAVNRKLMLVNEQAVSIKSITAFERRSFINYGLTANQGDYLIITNKVLTGASGPGDPVEDYRAYRSSAAGGSYNAKVYLIDQLVDQFAFGIKEHSLSVRNFLMWARRTYNAPLKNVFIIGKGVIFYYCRVYETHPDLPKLEMVPTFGNPASDNLLSAEGNSSMPLTPIGRLSVINKDEIVAYLNKVKVYEQVLNTSSSSATDNLWKKNVVHVTGANDDATTKILETALNGHRAIIEDTMFGARVYAFTKKSSEAVEQIASSRLTSLMREGISLLTYFGHSSATTLEFNLDNPQNYQNEGKYPVFIVMGCSAGSLFNFNSARLVTKETISERYVLADKRGSIAFLASTYLGIIHYLDIYNTRTYRSLSVRKYGATIGEIMDDAIRQVFDATTEEDFYARFQCEEFTLHGDPALKIHSYAKPDYVIEDPMVKASPPYISVAERNFKVDAKFANIGRATNQPIVVELKRTYPNLVTEVIRRDTLPSLIYMDSLSYVLPVDAIRDKGLNKLTITVDAANSVDELYETNNSVTKDIYIFEDEVRPVYPYNYSIVNQTDVKLIASTANPFSLARTYIMEIDTTEKFNSALKVSKTMNTSGGVLEFVPNISFADSTVYYWRVSASVTSGDPKWNTASFIYIRNSQVAGFGQSHLFQHFKSELNRIELDSASRHWKFALTTSNVFAHNGVYPYTSDQGGFYTGSINDVKGYIAAGCAYNEVMINVIDPITFKAWKNDYSGPLGLYQSYRAVCGAGREYNFEYLLGDSTWRRRLVNFLDIVPDGYYVLIRSNTHYNTAANTYASAWKNDQATWGVGNTLYDKLLNQGFAGIDSFNSPRSWMFFYKKNHASEFAPVWTVSEGIFDAITLNVNCISPDTLGTISSPEFGPAKAWHQVIWRGLEPQHGDTSSVSVVGIAKDGSETLLFDKVPITDEQIDVSGVDAGQYPELKLKLQTKNSINFAPYQLRYWLLTYDPVPEGVIAPNIYFTAKDTVDVGEPFNFGIAFKNISRERFDSIKVKLVITDKDNREIIIPLSRQKDLAPSDTIRLNTTINTRLLSGHNTLFVSFNPDDDQPEQLLFNNYGFKSLYVRPDSLNPLLDVTFDGVHILNNDIVSAKPAIVIKLKDEAKWLPLDDPNLLDIQVKYPDMQSPRTFSFNNDTLQFLPAGQAPNTSNTATVNFNPHFLKDGDYELIVKGKDVSENTAGAMQYKVAFKIINKPMISNMLNYPNPFTTSTAFVFTLTGSEVPQNLRIQVLTITGKIVKEITKDELGPLHIGRNITEFKWDGTDQYGQKLANGIYLYRVITNLNGKSLDKYKAKDDNTEQFFNNGYGKMYLMR